MRKKICYALVAAAVLGMLATTTIRIYTSIPAPATYEEWLQSRSQK